jgi:hypothetical protein
VEIIIEKYQNLPFQIEKKLIDALSKEVDKYKKSFKAKGDKLFKEIPEVGELEELLTELKNELQFISPHEALIEKTKRNHQFIMDKVKQYSPIKPLELKTDGTMDVD